MSLDIVLELDKTGVAVASAQVTLAEFKATALHNFSVTVKNTGSKALTDCKILAGPNAALALTDIDTVPAISDTLAAGASATYAKTGNPYGYIKVVATAAAPANDTTCAAYVRGN